MKFSGVDLRFTEPEGAEKYIPWILETSMGLGRVFLAVLCDAYHEEEKEGEIRVVLKLAPHLAPVKVCVSPLLKNKPELVSKAREVYSNLKKDIPGVVWDDNGNIGKRYRRQDEIGTPFCVVVDFESMEDGAVTIRHRDDGRQERVKIEELSGFIKERIK
jgi:glycyl-tRNA synthetase